MVLGLYAQDATQQPPDTGTVLQLRVNAVLVPVVVRDAQGRAIGQARRVIAIRITISSVPNPGL